MEKSGLQEPGEIGQNLELSRSEREEDLLELLYRRYRDGYPMERGSIYEEAEMPRQELDEFLQNMIREGYLEDTDPGEEIRLTDFGKAQGAECLGRHQNLTQFIQLFCGVDEKAAEENACRIEHVITGEVAEGFAGFLKYGDQAERRVRNSNLRFKYAPGRYPCRMCLYQPEIRYPRKLAEEQGWFKEQAELEIGREKSYVRLGMREAVEKEFWYFTQQGWRKAKAAGGGKQLRIPTDVFRFLFLQNEPIGEGECLTAWTGAGENETDIKKENCRELNIHIW